MLVMIMDCLMWTQCEGKRRKISLPLSLSLSLFLCFIFYLSRLRSTLGGSVLDFLFPPEKTLHCSFAIFQ
jgi:hypothetical protein